MQMEEMIIYQRKQPRYAGISTDWKKEVFKTGFDQNYNVNYSFGNENIKAYTALGYQGIDGMVAPSRFDRVSAKVNIDAKVTNWLKVNSSLNYINTKTKNTNDNAAGARAGVILVHLLLLHLCQHMVVKLTL
jgi:hypothetical protein